MFGGGLTGIGGRGPPNDEVTPSSFFQLLIWRQWDAVGSDSPSVQCSQKPIIQKTPSAENGRHFTDENQMRTRKYQDVCIHSQIPAVFSKPFADRSAMAFCMFAQSSTLREKVTPPNEMEVFREVKDAEGTTKIPRGADFSSCVVHVPRLGVLEYSHLHNTLLT